VKSNNVKQYAPRADARIAMRIPSQTLALVNRAADADGRSMSAMAVRLIQMGIAQMVAEGRIAV